LNEEEKTKKLQDDHKKSLESKFTDLKVELEKELESRSSLEDEVIKLRSKVKDEEYARSADAIIQQGLKSQLNNMSELRNSLEHSLREEVSDLKKKLSEVKAEADQSFAQVNIVIPTTFLIIIE
jgi:hypothetical protein